MVIDLAQYRFKKAAIGLVEGTVSRAEYDRAQLLAEQSVEDVEAELALLLDVDDLSLAQGA